MTDLLTWKAGPFSSHTGSAGGAELFTVHWHTRHSEPKHFMRCQLPGLQSEVWKEDDLGKLQAIAERSLAQWLALVGTSAAADANVFADPYSDPPRPLGRDVHIRFGTTEDGAFDVELEDGELKVSLYDLGGRGVAVLPSSNNSVRIRKVQP